MFARAFIEEKGNGRLIQESQLVFDYCAQVGIPTELYTSKKIARRQLPLDRDCFICGYMDSMHGAMRQLRIPVPEPVYYPASLEAFLHRRVWEDTVEGLRRRMDAGDAPVFAKPSGRAKQFTGRVFASHADLYFTASTSGREPVLCSDVVEWLSEYRVYVNGSEIVAIDWYGGDQSVALNEKDVRAAVDTFRRSGQAPVAYGIDFGVLASGEIALVEANDGYSLGAYSISSASYAQLLFARWRELLATAKPQ